MFQKDMWDDIWTKSQIPDWDDLSECIYQTIISEYGDIKGKRIIEVGSGSGKISLRLAREGATVSLLDFSDIALNLSRKQFEDEGLTAEYINADLLGDGNIFSEKYDLVWNAGVLEHFVDKDLEVALRHMINAVADDGLLLTFNPNARCLPYVLGKWFLEKTNGWQYGQEIPVVTLNNAFRSIGVHEPTEYSAGFVESLPFISSCPNGNQMKDLLRTFYHTINNQQRNSVEGYLLVSSWRNSSEQKTADRTPARTSSAFLPPVCIIIGTLEKQDAEYIDKGYRLIYVTEDERQITLPANKKIIVEDIYLCCRNHIACTRAVGDLCAIDPITSVLDENGKRFDIGNIFLGHVIDFFKTPNLKIICRVKKYETFINSLNA